MRYIFLLIGILFFSSIGYSQKSGDLAFIKDTLRIPKENKVVDAEYLITALKNGTTLQLAKANNAKFYLRICTSENLYFGKTDMLEIKSGSKSFFAKETTNYELGKNSGYYVIEIYKNYIGTLKEDGITGFMFGKAETSFSKQDCNQIKQMAKHFYENVCAKK
ncbi:MAG: hypothetical protein H0U95_16905 [Bacteroidetes bacterium]|nr:hypothetical protein [Bacteroidota bacterium]